MSANDSGSPGGVRGMVVRGIGASLIVAAAVLYKLFFHDVLAEARQGAASVTIYEKTVMLIGILPVTGLAMVALGENAERLLKFRGRPTALQIVLFAAVVAAGLGMRIWLGVELSALGYDDLGAP